MAQQLTGGSLSRIMQAYDVDKTNFLAGNSFTLQVLSVKPVPGKGAEVVTRNRLIISDGQNFAQSMLATQLNYLVDDKSINKFTIIKVSSYSISPLQDKRLIILLDVVVLSQADAKLGEPANVETSGGANISAMTTPAPSTMGSTMMGSTSSSTAPASTLVNQPRAAVSRPAATNKGPAHPIYPIESLSPYQNKWTIKARVTNKSDIRTFSSQRGDGKVFNVTLMDETGEIRATAWNAVVDDLFDKIEEGKVYFISRARVNIAKKKFASSSTDFELNLEKNTEIEECLDAVNVPLVKYNFCDIASLESLQKDDTCDVIAIVKESAELSEITTKAGKPLVKREITLVDKSEASVRMTLWGRQAEQFVVEDQPVVAFKGVKVGDFGGRSLMMSSGATSHINPDIPEAHQLRGWYDSQGHSVSYSAQTGGGGGGASAGAGGQFRRNELKTCRIIKDSELGRGETADFFSCRGTVVTIKADAIMYNACPGDNCSKKVTEGADGWRCEKCDRSYPEPERRFLTTMLIADWTDQLWLQIFNEVGQAIFGMTAQQLHNMEQEDASAAAEVVQQAHCKAYNFSCRAKQDNWNDQVRVRYGVNKVWPLEYKAEGYALLESIKQYQT